LTRQLLANGLSRHAARPYFLRQHIKQVIFPPPVGNPMR
jgi:hypothetical protein